MAAEITEFTMEMGYSDGTRVVFAVAPGGGAVRLAVCDANRTSEHHHEESWRRLADYFGDELMLIRPENDLPDGY